MSREIGRVTEAQVRRELIRMDQKASRRRGRIGTLVVLATALLAGALAAQFLFALADIRTSGMSDTLRGGDVVLCERMASPVRTGQLERGALALVRYLDSGMQRQTVRRVIAVAGDVVSVERDGRVTVNGEALEEPYAAYRSESDWRGGEATPGGALENPFASPEETVASAQSDATPTQIDDLDYPITVPDGKLFVLCDNRENAVDSRSSRFGLVGEADVLGLARAIIWPIHRVGSLTDD
ncbi:MAG: signal peptidase I [Clostridia bacterium]|nr:signal peptidase I [Clostridia bacterium]